MFTEKSQPNSRIVLATGNLGKVNEIQQIVASLEIKIVPQSNYAVPEADETALTFVENALIKARNAALHTGLAAIADDSGLEVDALNGAPGIYSSRFAGANANDQSNIDKLLATLDAVPEAQRTARFQCVMVFVRHAADPTPLICQGTWEGTILRERRGRHGFGYDPVFWVAGLQKASAELDPETKNQLSHRGQALRQLAEKLIKPRKSS